MPASIGRLPRAGSAAESWERHTRQPSAGRGARMAEGPPGRTTDVTSFQSGFLWRIEVQGDASFNQAQVLGLLDSAGVTMAGIDYLRTGRSGVQAWSAALPDPADAWDAGGQPPIWIGHRGRRTLPREFARILATAVAEAVRDAGAPGRSGNSRPASGDL